jgi:hypothetical protein
MVESGGISTTEDIVKEFDAKELYSPLQYSAKWITSTSTAPTHEAVGTETSVTRKIIGTAFSEIENEGYVSSGSHPVKADGLQKWEGRVLQVSDDVFTAELEPLQQSGPTIVAEFEIGLIDVDNEETLSPGDVFYLTVRTVWHRGFPTRTSALRLRRLGHWSEAELREVGSRAKRRLEAFRSYVD